MHKRNDPCLGRKNEYSRCRFIIFRDVMTENACVWCCVLCDNKTDFDFDQKRSGFSHGMKLPPQPVHFLSHPKMEVCNQFWTYMRVLSVSGVQWFMMEMCMYPGIIQDVELYSGAQVKTMTGIGINRFYWPLRDDVIWYPPMDIIGLIPEPVPVTKRHKEIKMAVWKEICKIWP